MKIKKKKKKVFWCFFFGGGGGGLGPGGGGGVGCQGRCEQRSEVFVKNKKMKKRGNKQCLLDTPRRVTVNNKRPISEKYAYIQKPWHY